MVVMAVVGGSLGKQIVGFHRRFFVFYLSTTLHGDGLDWIGLFFLPYLCTSQRGGDGCQYKAVAIYEK